MNVSGYFVFFGVVLFLVGGIWRLIIGPIYMRPISATLSVQENDERVKKLKMQRDISVFLIWAGIFIAVISGVAHLSS